MAWNGFLPDHPCKGCGKPLHGQDSGYPAELYAGTYTGLCYACTSKPAFRLTDYEYVSGAVRWSHAPYCPSHRRDRATFFGFEDCKKCRGRGQVVKPGSFSFSSYAAQCEECSKRHYAHPLIVAIKLRNERMTVVQRAYKAILEKTGKAHLKKLGLPTEYIPEGAHGHVTQNEALAELRDEANAHRPKDPENVDAPASWKRLTAAEVKRLCKSIFRPTLKDEEIKEIVDRVNARPARCK